jgi:hypothetical protein
MKKQDGIAEFFEKRCLFPLTGNINPRVASQSYVRMVTLKIP